MNAYHVSQIYDRDQRAQHALDSLLKRAGLTRDAWIEETYGVYDDAYQLLATGSLAANTLRCIAVDPDHQGEGLMPLLLSTLLELQAARGIQHVFLYTKPDSVKYFQDLGFYEIARVEGKLVFMENRRGAFEAFLASLATFYKKEVQTAAIVMNANPFTKGHQYLLERAASENAMIRCFVVSEDVSLVPFADRLALVKAGAAHLPNVTVHPSSSYIISSATFPSYFLKDSRAVTETQAQLDITVFARIAQAMGISRRYIGEEPFSQITHIYNEVMQAQLPRHGIACVLVPRREQDGTAISASNVRQLLHDGKLSSIQPLVPESTYAYFLTERGQETIRRIQATKHVRHD